MKLRVRRLGLSSWAQWQSGIVSWALCIARWQFFSNCFQAKALVDSLYHAYKKGTTFEPLSSFVKIVWIREQQVHRFQFCFHEFHEYISVIKDVHIVVDLFKISSVCTSKGRMYVRAETELSPTCEIFFAKGFVHSICHTFLAGVTLYFYRNITRRWNITLGVFNTCLNTWYFGPRLKHFCQFLALIIDKTLNSKP